MFSKTALFSAASLLLNIPLTSAAPTNCMADTRVISVRGSYEVLGQSTLRQVFTSVLNHGVNAVLQGTPYPAQLDYSNNDIYRGSVTAGVHSLQGIIKAAVAQCPQQKIVLIGYSQGAQVIGDALCSSTITNAAPLPGQYADHIKAVVLFGDPTKTNTQSFVLGGSHGNGNIPRWSNTECAPYTGKIASHCHPNDPVCDDGGDINQHLNYFPALDDAAASFIKSKVG